MVTIDQKLSLFSKLLHRSMNEKFTEEMGKLKEEYEVKIQKNKDAVDKEAEDIINKSRKKAEAEKMELASIIRVNMKKETMAVKEKHFTVLMGHLSEEIEKLIQSDKYDDYLLSLVKKLEETEYISNSLIIYMTNRDNVKYAENIRQELLKSQQMDCTFEIAPDSIIGGFIAEDPISNIRMDFSINTLLEDNKPYIMQALFQAIEAGETNGI